MEIGILTHVVCAYILNAYILNTSKIIAGRIFGLKYLQYEENENNLEL